MKHLPKILLFLCVVCSLAIAAPIDFSTPTGSTLSGLPVSATVTGSTGTNQISLTVTNLETNPTSVIQGISDVGFVLSGGQVAATTLTSSSTQFVTINSNGTYALDGTGPAGFVVDPSFAGGIRLCDLCAGASGPSNLIIGGPNAGTNTYSNANGSIAGNGPHNPFDFTSATFVLNVPGVTSSTTVTSMFLSFGTTEGNNITLTPNQGAPPPGVPEPTSLLLTGGGLVAVAMVLRRRKATN